MVAAKRILVISEGRHEIGKKRWVKLEVDSLPALPALLGNMLGPGRCEFECGEWRSINKVRGGRGTIYSRKVKQAITLAKQKGFDTVVIVIDRDRKADRDRIMQLRKGRDEIQQNSTIFAPCAVGTAVETFDAWMICDENAVAQAGGDKAKCHQNPESLDGKENTGKHPKNCAAQIFGSGEGLAEKYAIVARCVDIKRLADRCSGGFAPFAKDIKERIAPVLADREGYE